MIKTGKVILQKTPSVVSGKPCTRIEQGEPVRGRETLVDPGLKKVASLLKKSG